LFLKENIIKDKTKGLSLMNCSLSCGVLGEIVLREN